MNYNKCLSAQLSQNDAESQGYSNFDFQKKSADDFDAPCFLPDADEKPKKQRQSLVPVKRTTRGLH